MTLHHNGSETDTMTEKARETPARRWMVRGAGLTAATAALTMTLAACGGSSSGGSPTPSPAAASPARGGSAAGATGGAGPAAFGTIAAVSGNSLEVQNPTTGQTTVDFSAQTRITQQRTVTLAAVKPGLCVTATSVTPSATSSAAPSTGPPDQPRTITATTVLITSATNGSCGGFGGFGGGQRPSGASRPSAAPSSGARTGARGLGDVVSGQVKSVSGTAIAVLSTRRTFGASSSAAPTVVTDTVEVTSATTYSQTVSATGAALEVGKCATAQGSANSTGVVAATRIAVSTPGPQGCSAGGRFGFGGGRGTGARTGTGSGQATTNG
jgi:hypothetical protein